jgi:hypothetical protein
MQDSEPQQTMSYVNSGRNFGYAMVTSPQITRPVLSLFLTPALAMNRSGFTQNLLFINKDSPKNHRMTICNPQQER